MMVEATIIGLNGINFWNNSWNYFCYYLQEYGIDISSDIENSTMPSVMRLI